MQHTTKRRWIGRGAIFTGAFLAAVLGLAAALFTGTAPIGGSVQGGQVGTLVWDGAHFGGSDGMSCESKTQNNKLIIHATDAYPNTSCVVGGNLKLGGQSGVEDMEVTGIDLTLPPGWTAELVEGCGATLSRAGYAQKIMFRVTMGADAAIGSGKALAAGDGVKASPKSQNAPLECAS